MTHSSTSRNPASAGGSLGGNLPNLMRQVPSIEEYAMSKHVVNIPNNTDTGSINVGLGSLFNTKEEAQAGILSVQIDGVDATPRNVTYVMGSPKKGWFVCCKGSGKFPIGSLTVEVTTAD